MTTHTVSQHASQASINSMQAEQMGQYTLWQILGIWALAVMPMGALSWVVFPAVSPDFRSDPLGAGVTRMVLMTIGKNAIRNAMAILGVSPNPIQTISNGAIAIFGVSCMKIRIGYRLSSIIREWTMIVASSSW